MLDIKQIKGKVDFCIITIREDEFEAVLQRFSPTATVEGRRRYGLSYLKTNDNAEYVIALARCHEQGTGEGQNIAHDLIEDLDPQWLLLVGIAGGVPADEHTLGDVVAALRLHDFTITARLEGADGSKNEFAITGGPMHRQVQDLLAYLPAMSSDLGDWNSDSSIGLPTPPVKITKQNLYGDDEWKKRVRESLKRHFGKKNRIPRVITGAIASSDSLVKDTGTVKEWRQAARQLIAVEMELAGIYRAARQKDKEYPILAIRGISDIVGFKRHPDWTSYACHTAAAFAYALLKTKPIEPRSSQGSKLARASSTIAGEKVSELEEAQPLSTPSVLRKQELLISNLLSVTKLPEYYYAAPTSYKDRKEVWYALDSLGVKPKVDWIVKSHTLYSFHNLDEEPWNKIISGPASHEPTTPWAMTTDQARQNEFVELLNRCLIQKGEEGELLYRRKLDLLYFAPTPEKITRSIATRSLKMESSHEVVSAYGKNKEGTGPRYFKHHAFRWKFYRIDGQWYLEITPTYHYTIDGEHIYWKYEDLLSGIKRMENNNAVRGQVLMWADYLREHGGMFAQKYPFLEFGFLKEFKVDFGIDDDEWKEKESVDDPNQYSLLTEEL